MNKPRVILDCVANNYTRPDERIIEFVSDAGGGLISFQYNEDRTKLFISIYRTDKDVMVI